MADELTLLKARLFDSLRREGFTIFYGAFPSENVPQIGWNGDLEPDADHFVQAAKSLNVRVMYMNWVPFTSETIEQNVLLEEGRELTEEQTNWLNDRNSRLEGFREFAGQTGSVRVGFLLDGVFHFYERIFDWYESFGALLDEEMPGA